MRLLITLLTISIICSCGGGGTIVDPPVDDPPVNDPPVAKTYFGDWNLTARGDVPDGWPVTVTVTLVKAGSTQGTMVLPPAIADTLDIDLMSFRPMNWMETAANIYYDSDSYFSRDDNTHNYGYFTYYKSGTGDYFAFEFPGPDPQDGVTFTRVEYDAAKP